jgi:hypothetical protein
MPSDVDNAGIEILDAGKRLGDRSVFKRVTLEDVDCALIEIR